MSAKSNNSNKNKNKNKSETGTNKSTLNKPTIDKSIDFNEKYKPKTLDDIVGNVRQIYEIETWLKNYEKNKKLNANISKKGKKNKVNIKIDDIENETSNDTESDLKQTTFSTNTKQEHACLMLIGDHGVGKTSTLHVVLKNMNYTIQTFNLAQLDSNKSIPEHINKLTKGTNIFDKINNENGIKRVVVIDDIESANSPVEKNFILSLMKSNEEHWYIPTIFISSGKHTKLNSVLKSYSVKVQFNKPERDNLMILLSKIATKEHMCFDSLNVGYELVSHAQNDYRRLVSIIQDLKAIYGKKSISQEEIVNYQNISKKKDVTVEIFKSSAQMMVKYKNINDCLKTYEKEKVIIPLVIHQNYIKTIVNSAQHQGNKKFCLVNDISKSMAFGDLVENYIYSDQNWDMQEVHGFLSCAEPAFKIFSENLNVQEHYLARSMDFPFDLNRTSIKKINKRNIINSNNCLKNFEIKDFIFANRLIRQLMDDNKIEECANLFKGYNAKVENIESILKIDKINDTKTILATTTRKKLVQILGSKKTTTNKEIKNEIIIKTEVKKTHKK